MCNQLQSLNIQFYFSKLFSSAMVQSFGELSAVLSRVLVALLQSSLPLSSAALLAAWDVTLQQ